MIDHAEYGKEAMKELCCRSMRRKYILRKSKYGCTKSKKQGPYWGNNEPLRRRTWRHEKGRDDNT